MDFEFRVDGSPSLGVRVEIRVERNRDDRVVEVSPLSFRIFRFVSNFGLGGVGELGGDIVHLEQVHLVLVHLVLVHLELLHLELVHLELVHLELVHLDLLQLDLLF